MQTPTGQVFLSFAFSDKKDEEIDLNTKEVLLDAKDQKRQKQFELARALAVLGVKPSTFHSLHYGNKKKKVCYSF